jgi:hypothetical protein
VRGNVGYCNCISVALPGKSSDQLSFDGNIKISIYSSKSLKVIERCGNFTLAVHRYVRELLELPSTSFFGGTQGGVERQNFNPKINIKFTFTTKHRTVLLLPLPYKMAPGMCLSLLPQNIQTAGKSPIY